jgi:hypothetical protein
MKKNLTEIAFILDRSGSMQSMVEPAISGFNRLLREQQAVGNARFTLVLFDDCYEVPFRSVPIAEVVELDTSTFVPRGGTALLDAIGRTIDDLLELQTTPPEQEAPGQVIIAILTEGAENCSTENTWQDIAGKIRKLTDEKQWQFLFLGADQDAIATAARMNIDQANSANFSKNLHSYSAVKSALSRKMMAMRRSAEGSADEQTLQDATAPLDALREEEEGRNS